MSLIVSRSLRVSRIDANLLLNSVPLSWSSCSETMIAFLQRVSIACYAKRCISYRKSVRLTDRLTVRHTLVSCKNDLSYDHGVFTGG